MRPIPFNKPFMAGRELYYIAEAVNRGNVSSDGVFTSRCSRFLQEAVGSDCVLMTNSCTSALEIAVLLCDLGPGDEVILPSFTFVSAANAVLRAGARPVFVDIRPDTLNLDEERIEAAITPRTRVIMPMHYAGVGCEMDRIAALAEVHGLSIIEDAAQAVNSFYKGRPLGSIGRLGCFSFHETKNYICGEGGALVVNDPELVRRAEIIRDKGTNRQQFERGDVDRYTWVDLGSSYVPSEINCAFLFAQLEAMDELTERRRRIFEGYRELLQPLADEGLLRLPAIPDECHGNCHAFYVLAEDAGTRDALLRHLQHRGIHAVFHYVPLHTSPMGRAIGCDTAHLPVTDDASARLLRLPFYYELTEADLDFVAGEVASFLQRPAARPRAPSPG